MAESVFLVFGDLHGRILPAFRLASVWARDHAALVAGILQVGDLGYFPDPGRLDKATRRYAAEDPLELGGRLVDEPSEEADEIFADPDTPSELWFTAGNHEDFEVLDTRAHGHAFAVDAYHRVWCVRNGHTVTLPGGLRLGALWGIDGQAPVRRRNVPSRARIDPTCATRLACMEFDVLLTHDGPRDAIVAGSGSQEVGNLIRTGQPAFAFFGHYKGQGHRIEADYGRSEVYHLSGIELRERGQYPEDGSVGVLQWDGRNGRFRYLEPSWLRTFSRHNWRYR